MRRRAFLAAAGLGSLGVVGGIAAYEPPALREVAIRNRTGRTRTVEVRIFAAGDIVTDEAHELNPGDHRQLACEWPGAARTFRIAARLDTETEWKEGTLSSSGDHCRWIAVVDDDRYTDEDTEATVVLRWIAPCPSPSDADPDRTACGIPTWSRGFRTL